MKKKMTRAQRLKMQRKIERTKECLMNRELKPIKAIMLLGQLLRNADPKIMETGKFILHNDGHISACDE